MSVRGRLVGELAYWNNQVLTVGTECAEDCVEYNANNPAEKPVKPEDHSRFMATAMVRDSLEKTIAAELD